VRVNLPEICFTITPRSPHSQLVDLMQKYRDKSPCQCLHLVLYTAASPSLYLYLLFTYSALSAIEVLPARAALALEQSGNLRQQFCFCCYFLFFVFFGVT